MKKIAITLLSFFFIFSLSCDSFDDDKDQEDNCKKWYKKFIILQSIECSDPNYLSNHGYTDYNDCMDINLIPLLVGYDNCMKL